MPSVLNMNVDLVVNALVSGNATELKGMSAGDIIAVTGLSRSTVYRAIRKCDAIIKIPGMGDGPTTYWVSPIRYSEWKNVHKGATGKSMLLPLVADSYRKRFLNHPWGINLQAIQERLRISNGTYPLRDHWVNLMTVVNKSFAFQRGEAGPAVEDIAACRQSIDELMRASLDSYLFLEALRRNPNYANDENFWALFPIDESGVE